MQQPSVDFYVLPTADIAARLRFACRLIEKAFLDAHRVRVRLEGEDDVAALDDLLWTFSDRSFVPHEPGPGNAATAPVVLATAGTPDPDQGDLLVNLGTDVPSGWGRYARIVEIVDADATRRQLGRTRFRYYRDQGLQPATHESRSEP